MDQFDDFETWRQHARKLLHHHISPEKVEWRLRTQNDLFPTNSFGEGGTEEASTFEVPKRFLQLAQTVLCHQDPHSASLLYRLLYRLCQDKTLLHKTFDEDVREALYREKSVRHDYHHMQAFLRFKEVPSKTDQRQFIAWYEPEHYIVARIAPFFVRRFSDMDWNILTPKGQALFQSGKLTLSSKPAHKPNLSDETEDLWQTYFSHTFNPARLKVKTMLGHMPKKYWTNMPETGVIKNMIAEADKRVVAMQEQQPQTPPQFHKSIQMKLKNDSAEEAIELNSIDSLNQALKSCQTCPLHCHATQVVCGEGSSNAKVMIIGEQPGDKEDLAGRPFVGPAGQLFHDYAKQAGLNRDFLYLTNAVKHFKFDTRKKLRIHRSPDNFEIQQCRPWLMQEIALVKPALIVTMGKTAFFALTGIKPKMTNMNVEVFKHDGMPDMVATFHPSYLLRLKDSKQREKPANHFLQSLQLAGTYQN